MPLSTAKPLTAGIGSLIQLHPSEAIFNHYTKISCHSKLQGFVEKKEAW
tara:strand:- start:1794 stop:1940 length:147 start_codon:yes stop_codon:yes gene_type:complete